MSNEISSEISTEIPAEMFSYAAVSGGVVVGLQQSSNEILNAKSLVLIVGDLPEMGSTYLDGVFTAPVIVIEAVKRITLGAFRSRFTLGEKVSIEDAAKIDTEVSVISADLNHSSFIDVDSLELQWGLALYVDKGLLTSDRLSILLADGTPSEAY